MDREGGSYVYDIVLGQLQKSDYLNESSLKEEENHSGVFGWTYLKRCTEAASKVEILNRVDSSYRKLTLA